MAGAVSVVETVGPEKLAREGVESEAGGSLGEDGGGEGDEAFEDESVGFAFEGGGVREV